VEGLRCGHVRLPASRKCNEEKISEMTVVVGVVVFFLAQNCAWSDPFYKEFYLFFCSLMCGIDRERCFEIGGREGMEMYCWTGPLSILLMRV
jgi:hypothetical protein